MERVARELEQVLGRGEDVIWPAPRAYLGDQSPLTLKAGVPAESHRAVVARPRNTMEVVAILEWALAEGMRVTPFGSGTNVVGAIDGSADIVLSLELMTRTLDLDEVSQVVT